MSSASRREPSFSTALCGKSPLFPQTPITPAVGLPGYGRLPPPPTFRHPPTPLGKRYAFPTVRRPSTAARQKDEDAQF
jgi:hypothetical protein